MLRSKRSQSSLLGSLAAGRLSCIWYSASKWAACMQLPAGTLHARRAASKGEPHRWQVGVVDDQALSAMPASILLPPSHAMPC